MTDQDRRLYISNLLVTKQVVTGGSKHDVHKFHDMIIPRLPSSLHTVDREDVDPCSICLNEYEEGEEICWSHNKNCDHVFHRKCITEWLVRHDECPICRQDFLSLNDLDDEVPDTEHPEQAPSVRNNLDEDTVLPSISNAVDGDISTEVSRPSWIGSLFHGFHFTRARIDVVQPTRRNASELSEVNGVRLQPAQDNVSAVDDIDFIRDPTSVDETNSIDGEDDIESGIDEIPDATRPVVPTLTAQ